MTIVMFDTLMTIVIRSQEGKGSSMRVAREQTAKNREKMLRAAARMFRERGIGATGVDAITSDAGLTHGAVYSQFGSKEAVAAEAIRSAMAAGNRQWQRIVEREGAENAFATIVSEYLSPEHRDAAGGGCVVAALASEIARQSDTVRDVFTGELKRILEYLSRLTPATSRADNSDEAIAAFAAMVGGLVLARTVSDEKLSNRILKITAKRLLHSPKTR